ncbi:MAG: DNA polymerase III subunit beta [Lachnospiraceae bacterium]|nr:DNA polymerase III subunit beta [Lachnospiraceae bacterium]
MEIRVAKQELANGISIVSKAVPSKTTMSILECIMIDARGDSIRLIANDMELGIETAVAGQIVSGGRIAVGASMFSNIIRKLPDNEVCLTTDGEKVTITCENARFTILGRTGEDFSYLPELDQENGIKISQFTLREMITKTIFSISGNESNGMMTGELLETKGGRLRMVALDGHRIAMRRVAAKEEYPDRRVIIAGKALSEISKILSGDMEKGVAIYFTDKHAQFVFDSTQVVSRLIDGTYYNIDSMLSGNYTTTVKVNRQQMLGCLDRATLLVREEDKKPIIVMLRGSEMEFRINTTLGSMNETVSVEKEGDDMNIGFNPKFVIEALRAIEDEEITIYLVSPKAPCFIRNDLAGDVEGQEYCYLILPVNFITVD